MRAVEVGYDVVGLDVDEGRVKRLADGDSFVEDVAAGDRRRRARRPAATASRPTPTTAPASTSPSITVPTPLRDGAPRPRPTSRTPADALAPLVRPGCARRPRVDDLPGHDRRAARADPRARVGTDRRARLRRRLQPRAHRSRQPHATRSTTTPKIVSGITPSCLDRVDAFYATLVDDDGRVSARRASAELAKLVENTFRHVNVALVNELAMFARDLGIDVWETIDAAATKPFGFMRFTPGPGRRRPLPADRSELPVVGRRAAPRPTVPVRRAGQRHQRPHARATSSPASSTPCTGAAWPSPTPGCSCSAWRTSATPATPASRRRSPSSSSCSARGADVAVADPHVVEDVIDDGRRPPGRRSTPTRSRPPMPSSLLTDHDAFDCDLVVANARYVLDTRHRWSGDAVEHSERRGPRRRRACRAGRGCRRRSPSTSCWRCARPAMLAAVFATKPGDRTAVPARRRRRSTSTRAARRRPPTSRPASSAGALAGRRRRPACTATSPTARPRSPRCRRAASACRSGSAPTPSTSARSTPAELAARARRRGGRSWRATPTSPRRCAPLGATPRLVGHGVDLDRFRPPRRDRRRARSRCWPSAGWSRRRASTCSLDAARPRRPRRGASTSSATARSAARSTRSSSGSASATGSRFVGRLTHDELPGVVRARADVVVVPSRVDGRDDRDGLPNVVLEAMASGRPVVASDVAAIATAVAHGAHRPARPAGRPGRAGRRASTASAPTGALRRRLGAAPAPRPSPTTTSPRCGRRPRPRRWSGRMAERAVAYVAEGLPAAQRAVHRQRDLAAGAARRPPPADRADAARRGRRTTPSSTRCGAEPWHLPAMTSLSATARPCLAAGQPPAVPARRCAASPRRHPLRLAARGGERPRPRRSGPARAGGRARCT